MGEIERRIYNRSVCRIVRCVMLTITIEDADDIEELFLMYERMKQILDCWNGECDCEHESVC